MNALPVTQTQVDPRVRMKEIRSLVKDHVTGKNKANVDYLGQLKLPPEDMTRMVIALQDMVTKERQKHASCRNHLLNLMNTLDSMDNLIQTLTIQKIQMQAQLHSGISVMEAAEKHINSMTELDLETARQRDALLTTIKLMGENS